MHKCLLISILLLCYVISYSELDTLEAFMKFTDQHSKKYSSMEEYIARYNIFKTNYEHVQQMTVNKDTTHSLGVTRFMDMTPQEFRRIFLNLKIDASHFSRHSIPSFLRFFSGSPSSFDWRDKGAVGPVKDQGQCGSCWAFSTVGNLEGLNAIKSGKIVQYSEQQLVDCDKGNDGCDGGLMDKAFDYLKQAGGIEKQSDYPYHGMRETCQFNPSKAAFKVTGAVVKNDMDEKELMDMLVNTGPLAIALNADPLQFYTGGVLDQSEQECNPSGLNHGVTLVGYGSEDGKDYWIVKNSWGSSWGEMGYFRIRRGQGTCGINKYITSATIE
jgi:cathepsin F